MGDLELIRVVNQEFHCNIINLSMEYNTNINFLSLKNKLNLYNS